MKEQKKAGHGFGSCSLVHSIKQASTTNQPPPPLPPPLLLLLLLLLLPTTITATISSSSSSVLDPPLPPSFSPPSLRVFYSCAPTSRQSTDRSTFPMVLTRKTEPVLPFIRKASPIERLPIEILYEIFQHLLSLSPSPIGRVSHTYEKGYNIKVFPGFQASGEKRDYRGIRYLHPFVSLKCTCKVLSSAVDQFCEHLLGTHNYGQPPPLRSGTQRSRQTRTFHFLEMLWTQCCYCNKKSKKRGIIANHLHMCSACDKKHFPKFTMTDAKRMFRLEMHELDDPRNRIRKGYYMVHGTLTTMYLEADIKKYVKKKEEGMDRSITLTTPGTAERAAWREALRAGLLANGLEPVIKGIGYPTLSLEEFDPLEHARNFKTRTCAEIVRFQVLVHRIMTETSFAQNYQIMEPGFLDPGRDGSSCRSRRTRLVQAHTENKIVDLVQLALFQLFLKDFGLLQNDPDSFDTLIMCYLYSVRHQPEDNPFSLINYPVYFRSPDIPKGCPREHEHLYYTLYPREDRIQEVRREYAMCLREDTGSSFGLQVIWAGQRRYLWDSKKYKLEKWYKAGAW